MNVCRKNSKQIKQNVKRLEVSGVILKRGSLIFSRLANNFLCKSKAAHYRVAVTLSNRLSE